MKTNKAVNLLGKEKVEEILPLLISHWRDTVLPQGPTCRDEEIVFPDVQNAEEGATQHLHRIAGTLIDKKLMGWNFRECDLTILPPGEAEISYMGITSRVRVAGFVGITGTVTFYNQSRKLKAIWVSHPFHQLRLI